MKRCSVTPVNYNLDIRMYSFQEILTLFELPEANNITQEQLKRAKLMVLKTHPDKSRLPPEYFLFYTAAFKIIVEFYNNQQRTTKEIPTTKMKYDDNTDGFFEKNPAVLEKINSIPSNKFHKVFNDLFDKNQMGKQIVNKNEWFSKDENDEMAGIKVANISAMNKTFEQIKEKQQGMVIYKGVRELPFSGISASNLYEDMEGDGDGGGDGNGNVYIENDPFSKLKFEDIKKVHKNETIFAVGEKDYEKIPKYQSVEQYHTARNMNDISMETEQENLRILKQRETDFQNKMIQKEYLMKKKEIETINKNKSIYSYFLQIE